MPVIPFPSERVLNSATFMRRYIVLSIARNVWKLHFLFFYLIFFKFSISFKNYTMYACNSCSIWKSIQFCNFYVQVYCAFQR